MKEIMLWVLIIAALVIVVGVPVYGYVANIVKLCRCDFDTPLKAEVIRGIGVCIPPVGMITGFLTIEDGKPIQGE